MTREKTLRLRLLRELEDLFDGVCHDCSKDERIETCEAKGGHCRKVYDCVDENVPAEFGRVRRTFLKWRDARDEEAE